MSAAAEKNRPVDHIRPLPPTVIGRGTTPIEPDEIDALYDRAIGNGGPQ